MHQRRCRHRRTWERDWRQEMMTKNAAQLVLLPKSWLDIPATSLQLHQHTSTTTLFLNFQDLKGAFWAILAPDSATTETMSLCCFCSSSMILAWRASEISDGLLWLLLSYPYGEPMIKEPWITGNSRHTNEIKWDQMRSYEISQTKDTDSSPEYWIFYQHQTTSNYHFFTNDVSVVTMLSGPAIFESANIVPMSAKSNWAHKSW